MEWGEERRGEEGQDVNSIKIRFIAALFQIEFPFPFERTTTTLVEAPKIPAKKKSGVECINGETGYRSECDFYG